MEQCFDDTRGTWVCATHTGVGGGSGFLGSGEFHQC